MNGIRSIILLTGFALPLMAANDFSRYELILQRRPFSSPVVEAPPPPPETATAPPAFVQELRMVAITESPAGVRVGFVNTRKRPPKPYYLYIGDSEDGILLADADFDSERALLRRDGEQFWMTMGMGVSDAPPDESERPRRTASARPAVQPPPVAGETAISYAERRRQRLEEMRRRAQESRQTSEEDVERRLQEYQMQLIREGKTPLPIPITEEMDAQLVEEGILPPRD